MTDSAIQAAIGTKENIALLECAAINTTDQGMASVQKAKVAVRCVGLLSEAIVKGLGLVAGSIDKLAVAVERVARR